MSVLHLILNIKSSGIKFILSEPHHYKCVFVLISIMCLVFSWTLMSLFCLCTRQSQLSPHTHFDGLIGPQSCRKLHDGG